MARLLAVAGCSRSDGTWTVESMQNVKALNGTLTTCREAVRGILRVSSRNLRLTLTHQGVMRQFGAQFHDVIGLHKPVLLKQTST